MNYIRRRVPGGGMWKSALSISKVCGKGGKHAPPFSGLSINRHFLGPLAWSSILRRQPQPLKEFGFCLLHSPCRIGVADGGSDPLQRFHTQSIAQVLCRFLQQRQGLQRSLIALVSYPLAALGVDLHISLSTRTMIVQIWVQVFLVEVVDAVRMARVDVS